MCYKINIWLLSILIGVFLLITPDLLHAQNDPFSAQYYAQRSMDIQKKGMIVLGSWATLNIISGSVGTALSEGSTRYFHQMNAGWNLINLGIAGMALYNLSAMDAATLEYGESLANARSLDKLLLLNTGLDVAYMAMGAWMWERGLRKQSVRLEGYGKSLLVQGGFLFVFDLIFYLKHSPVTHDLLQISDKLSLTASGFRITF